MVETMRISVRQLVEFVYQSGDLDLRYQGKSRMTDGIKVHQKIQKSQGAAYRAEVSLSKTVCIRVPSEAISAVDLVVSGRADGVLETEDGCIIDEIKGTSTPLDKIEENTFPVHWAQAKIYGAIYCEEAGLDGMGIQLTYADFDSGEIKRFKKAYDCSELAAFFDETVERYKKWVVFKAEWLKRRNESTAALTFPFESYRTGQRALAVSVFNAIKDEGVQFVQAATGTGKTISTLFPALKSIGEGAVDKIFYLTAKAIAKGVAEEALERMRRHAQALSVKSLTLTAKDKVCLNDEVACFPEKCPYAKGHYDRTLDALWAIINNEDHIDRTILCDYAEKYRVCPYEFSLDVSLYADVIICDYNYVFDPRVYLRRFFDVISEAYVFLVDEAHNLVDRARTMYSASLEKRKFTTLVKNIPERDKALKTILNGVNRLLLEERRRCDDDGVYVSPYPPEALYEGLKRRTAKYEKWLSDSQQSPVHEAALDLYFDWLSYMRAFELYNDSYLSYIVNGDTPDTVYKLFCVQPASILETYVANARACIFFSATLSPIDYYRDMLYSKSEKRPLDVPSPFPPSNQMIGYITDVSVKYQDRDQSLLKVCRYIYEMVRAKKGNYMVFFPSYRFMRDCFNAYEQLYPAEQELICQEREFTEADRAAFLKCFDTAAPRTESLLSFVVMGSHFSEGVDLHGEQLIGVMVVGVGLPMFNFESDLIKAYFDERTGCGFEFAYQFPAVNKVMQSAGRVIRTANDKGVVLLLDSRYAGGAYRRFYPRSWGQMKLHDGNMATQLEAFWSSEGSVKK